MNFDNWKAHPHYLGLLMTKAKGKSNLEKYEEAKAMYNKKFDEYFDTQNKTTKTALKIKKSMEDNEDEMNRLEPIKNVPHLSNTCKEKLLEVYIEAKTGRKKRIKTKQMEKGLLLEEDAITEYSLFTGEFHKKNGITAVNDYLEGTMDFESGDISLDTKVSWDLWSFWTKKYKSIDTINHWQGDGYMWLYGKYFHKVINVLLNTPDHLLKAEERKVMYEMFGSEGNMTLASDFMIQSYNEEIFELRKSHIFNKEEYGIIPLNERIKVFMVERDEARIEAIKQKVIDCRWYLNNIENLNEQEDDTQN